MSEYIIPVDKLLLGGQYARGNTITIETVSGAHGIDFPDEIAFEKTSIHKNGIQSDTYNSQNGTDLLAFENNRLVFKVPTTLTNIDINGLTTASISSQNYANQSLEHELDALTTAQNTILARTQGLTASKIMKSNGSGILSVSSLTEGDVNTLSDNQTVSGNKTHSGDIIISDLTASKLVLTDANKKLVSASITESDLFKLNQDTNTQNGSGSAVQTIINQSSDESNTNCAIRLTKGTNTPLSMEIKIAGSNCFMLYSNQLNFAPNGGISHTQLKDTGLNLFSSSHKYMIAGSQISSANLSNDANLVKLNTSENNFTGIVDAVSYKQGNTALNFSHLAGSASTGQIPDLPTSQITSGTFDIARLPDLPSSTITSGTFADSFIPSLASSKITSGTFDIARLPSLPASQITSGTISDDRLNTNILRTTSAETIINTGNTNGTNFHIRHSSNFQGAPSISVEDYNATGTQLQAGTLTLDSDDVAIKNSDADGGVSFFNNNNTFLGRLDNDGMNIKSGLTYKVDGTTIQTLTSGTQTIAGVKTFSSKPVFSAGITSNNTSDLVATNITGNLVQTSGTTDLTGNVNVDGNLVVETGHVADLPPTTIRGTLNQINGAYTSNGKFISSFLNVDAAVQLRNGQTASGSSNNQQISFGYNGTDTFTHVIKTRHSAGDVKNSTVEFHINDTSNSSSLTSGTIPSLFIRGDGVEAKTPLMNGCTAVAQFPRFLISQSLGEDFIDTVRVIKMKCNLFRCSTLDSNNHKHIRVDQTSVGEGNVQVKGLGQSGNLPNTSNPNPIIVYHSTSENSTTHDDTAIFALDYAADTAFGVTGEQSFLSCEGYIYKQAEVNNNFSTATKTAVTSFWGVRVRKSDNLRLYIDNKIVFMQNTQGTGLFQGVFTMQGHFAHIRVEQFNSNSTAFVNLVFHCVGTSS